MACINIGCDLMTRASITARCYFYQVLTHLTLDKMATILAGNIYKCIFLNENDKILIQLSLKFVPRSPIDIKPALVQVMAWCQTGDKPLPEPMPNQFTDAYMPHWKKRVKSM